MVVVHVSGTLQVEQQGITQGKDGSILLFAEDAYTHNNEGSTNARLQDRGEDPDNIGYWVDPEASVEWEFKVSKPGSFDLIDRLRG